MSHTKCITREAPATAFVGIANKVIATLVPGWPATIFDVANGLWTVMVVRPLAAKAAADEA